MFRQKIIFTLTILALCLITTAMSLKSARPKLVAQPDEKNTKLIQVYIMFRHGARSWIQTYPNETIPVSYWDQDGGLGQLTSVGKEQLAKQGEFFNNYYNCAFGKPFNPAKSVARSTDYRRTIASVQSFLSSVFVEPIGVVSIPWQNDTVLFAKSDCPRYQQLKNEARTSLEYLKIESDNSEFLANMSKLSGISDLNYYHLWEIADHLLVNEAHRLPIATWITENRDQIMLANDYTFFIDFITTEMGKLVAGGLLNDVLTNMKDRIFGVQDKQLYVYGIHDNYMAGMQKLLETSDQFMNPNFATSYVLELRKDSRCNYYVRVLFKNDVSTKEFNFRPVRMRNCEEFCPFNKFLEITKDKSVQPNEFATVCMPQN